MCVWYIIFIRLRGPVQQLLAVHQRFVLIHEAEAVRGGYTEVVAVVYPEVVASGTLAVGLRRGVVDGFQVQSKRARQGKIRKDFHPFEPNRLFFASIGYKAGRDQPCQLLGAAGRFVILLSSS